MYVDLSAHGVTDSLAMCGALLEEVRACSVLLLLTAPHTLTAHPPPSTTLPPPPRYPPHHQAGVAMTPGVDFEDEGCGLGERRVRVSFPGSTEHVAEAMRRLQQWWQSEQGRRWHT